jgi:hypothetical protein
MLRNLGFVARTFDVLSPETARLSLTRFHLRLNCQRRFQRERSESVDEQLADGGAKSIAANHLAYRLDTLDVLMLAGILRDQAIPPVVRAHRHSLTAPPADDQPLQKRRTLTWWTCTPVLAERPSIGAQALEIVVIGVPGDVARMCIANQHLPLVTRQGLLNVNHNCRWRQSELPLLRQGLERRD